MLSTGSEILEGLYPDTNAQWLAHRLDEIGYDVVAIRAAGDDPAGIRAALQSLGRETALIISTGGLGPTEDDRHRDVCADLWESPLVFHADLMEEIEARLRKLGRKSIPKSNRRQAFIPSGADPLSNAWGTAPGFVLSAKGDLPSLIALPGPPIEMKPMFEKRALPWLQEHCWPGVIRQRAVIHTIGWPEALVNDRLSEIFSADENLQVTMLARSGKIDVRLTATDVDEKTATTRLEKWRKWVLERIPPEFIWGSNDETLEEVVNRLLVERGWTIAVAESCTGGLIAQRLTSVPGASRIMVQSVVTYADEAKQHILGVSEETLKCHGAVSEECVREMAEGVRRWASADVGLSISGIAGPTGGTEEKPVGTVWMATNTERGAIAEHHLIMRKERESIRLWSADRALNLARHTIQRHQS